MKYHIVVFLFMMVGLNVQSQLDSLDVSNLIIGEWKFDYSTHYKSKSQNTDTMYLKEINRLMYLNVTPTTVEEISYDIDEENKKLNMSEGKGDWKIYISENKTALHVVFSCGGIVLCGDYEVCSINTNQLILKDFVEFEDGSFQYNTIYLIK